MSKFKAGDIVKLGGNVIVKIVDVTLSGYEICYEVGKGTFGEITFSWNKSNLHDLVDKEWLIKHRLDEEFDSFIKKE